jgi:hypothetical protein
MWWGGCSTAARDLGRVADAFERFAYTQDGQASEGLGDIYARCGRGRR